jgi:hypothetical protein
MPWRHEGPMRECKTCKRVLPLTREHFGLHDHGRDGFNPHCRVCYRLRKKAHRLAEQARRAQALPPLAPGQICDECCDLGHRRPAAGCPRCKLAYVPLPPVELVTRRSYEPAVAV